MSDASGDDHELGDDDELALLGVLATGLEFRQQQTNGLHIGEAAGRQAHEELLELQRGAGGPED
ncbi:MAG TPA: hypothetical protein VK640_11070 [Actinomycetes bacterium]|nr:hypothetical protein [Actinomycetes bacterium]